MADKVTIENIELTKLLREEKERLLEIEEKRVAVAKEEAAAAGQIFTRTEELTALAEARRKTAAAMRADISQSTEELEKQIVAIQEQIVDDKTLDDQTRERLEKKADYLGEILKLQTDPKLLKARQDELDGIEAAESAFKARVKQAKRMTDQMGSLVGVSDNWTSSITGQAYQLLQTEDGLARIATGFKDTFSLQNIGASLIEKVTEESLKLLWAQDQAIASFKAATGAGDAYSDVIVETQFELRTYGVSAEEAGKATEALFRQVSQFTEMSKSARKELAATTAILGKFGISGQAAGSSMEVFNKALGMTAAESAQASREMFALGTSLGIAPEVIFNEFGPAAKQLAAHGDNMIQVFEGLAAASKATGVEMGNLLTLASLFDEFESGATAVGKLNALLGGPYLNSIEMLNATEEERIRLLIQSLEVSGKSFDQLGKYEQKAIAAAVGITDMAEANKLFNTSLSAYDTMQQKAALATISQKEFEESSRNAMSVQAKFTTIMENFAVKMTWVLDVLGAVASAILWVQEKAGNAGGIILALVGSVLFLVGAFKSLSFAAASLGKAVGTGLAAGLRSLGSGAGAAGQAAMAGAKGLLAMGFAALMIGGGIAAAALGVAQLAEAFSKLNTEQIIGATIAIALFGAMIIGTLLALTKMAAATAPGVGILLAVGAAFFAIGAGIWLAADGIATLVPGMVTLIETITSLSAGEFVMLLGMMVTLAAIGLPLASALFLIGAGFMGMAAGVGMLMWALDLDKLKALADLASSITTMLFGPEGATAPASPGGGGPSGSPFTDMVSAVNNLDKEKIDFAKELATVAMDYNFQVAENFGTTGTAPFTAATAGVGAGPAVPSTGAGATNLPPLYLVLNGEIFGRLVAKALAKEKGLDITQGSK